MSSLIPPKGLGRWGKVFDMLCLSTGTVQSLVKICLI